MSNLPECFIEIAREYSKLNDDQKRDILNTMYHEYGLSWAIVGKFTSTYANKVRRDATRLGIKSRNKSEAQAEALESKRHPHPTKDKGHDENAKIKISDKIADKWLNMSKEDRQKRRDLAKEKWDQKTPDEIRQFREAAGEGVRKAAKEGSALEQYLCKGLIKAGYKPEFHKEHFVIREKLQIDIFLPELNVAIEVDGPSHFDDIWGEENLRKNQERDAHKSGILLERGTCIIRVRQTKSLSQKYRRQLLELLLAELANIKAVFPPIGKRHIILGD